MSNSSNSQDDGRDFEPQLDSAVWSVLSQKIDTEAIARVKARAATLRSITKSESVIVPSPTPSMSVVESVPDVDLTRSTKPRVRFFSRSLMMKCLSTAAAIVIVVGTMFLVQSSPSAFGEVIKQLREAKSFTYVSQVYVEGSAKPIVTKTLVAEDGRQRQELAGGTITIMDSVSRPRLTLITGSKIAIVNLPDEANKGPQLKHPLDWIEDLKAHGDKPDEQLGKKEIDGHSVEGFVVKQGESTYIVWIDTKSKELFQIESDMPVKGSTISKIVRTEFRFNEKLDESLFSFEVPEGYKVQQQMKIPSFKGVSGEKRIQEALRSFTKRSGGTFPKSISEWGEWAVLFSKSSQNGQLDENSTETMAHLGSIMPFLMGLKKDNYQYLGAGKSVDDRRCIVFWYRNKDATLRAIFNDLSIGDIQEKDLPKD